MNKLRKRASYDISNDSSNLKDSKENCIPIISSTEESGNKLKSQPFPSQSESKSVTVCQQSVKRESQEITTEHGKTLQMSSPQREISSVKNEIIAASLRSTKNEKDPVTIQRKRQSAERACEESNQESPKNECAIPAVPSASPLTSMPGATNGQSEKSDEEKELVEFIRAKMEDDDVPKLPKDRESPTVESEGRRSPSSLTGSTNSVKSRKKRPATWFNSVLSPTYKTRSDELRKQFKDVPHDERLLIDYSCALQKNILVHGRLYVTQGSICFYSNIFTMETTLTIKFKDITAMTKERTARVIPNAIQITTGSDKYFFTSFGSRDKAYLTMFRVWQNSQLEQPLSSNQLWSLIHAAYGEDLGLTASDDDYTAPSPENVRNLQYDHFDRSIIRKEENEKADGSFLGTSDLNAVNGMSVTTASTDDLVNSSVVNGGSPSPTVPTQNLIVEDLDKENELDTDSGDTTEDSEGEVVCSGHDHGGVLNLDKEFNINVDVLFDMLFTDSDFMKAFYKERKTTDVVTSPWQAEEMDNASKGRRFRTLSYTLTLGASFGPKTSPATEKQSCSSDCREGRCYYVECRCLNDPSLPYGENFYCVNNFCLTRVSANRSRLKVHSEIVYIKSVWGLIKNIIEKNVNQGMTQHYNSLRAAVQRASDSQVHKVSVTKKRLRRRHRQTSSPEKPTSVYHVPSIPSVPQVTEDIPKQQTPSFLFGTNSETLVRLICAVLMCLVLMNAVLFYKLSWLEQMTSLERPDLDLLKESPMSQEEWLAIFKSQTILHEQELDKWRHIIDSSVSLLDEMKKVLEGLQEGVQKRQDLLKT